MDTDGCCPIGSGGESGQVCLLGGSAHTVSVSCCPIEVSQIEEAKAIPEDTSNQSEEAGKTVWPLAYVMDVSEKKIQQKCRPELPADGMLGVAEEVAEFEGLLDLLEEGFDTPATLVQVADARGCPIQIIGEEDHDNPFTINFDPCLDSAQPLWILSFGLGADQGNLIVTEDVCGRFTQPLATNMVAQVVLGSGNPEDAPLVKMEKVGKMDVCLVKDGDLTGLEPGTQGHDPGAVVVGGFLNDGKSGEETLQIKTQMHLGSSFASAVFGPVHAVGNQGNSGGIHSMDCPLEPSRQSPVTTSRTKSRRKLLKMIQYMPEQILDHVAVANLVRVRERVAAWRHRTADYSQFGRMMAQCVANIVQPNRMGHLGKKQAHHMTPGSKGTRLLVDPVLAGQFLRQMRRDKFTKLMQCVRVMLGRRYCFHTPDSLVGIRRRPPFFNWVYKGLQLHPVG